MKKTPLILMAMRLLALLGLGICLYLLYFSLQQDGQIPGCLPGSGCNSVLQSHWSKLLGWPVALPATAIYIMILAALLHIRQRASILNAKLAWAVLLTLLSSSAMMAVWFIYVQKAWIGNFCVFCTTLHGISLLLFVLALKLSQKRDHRILPSKNKAYCLLVGVVLGSAFIATQTLAPSDNAAIINTTLDQQLNPSNDQQLVGPTVGSPSAKFSIIHVYDYTCIHCKQMHFLLKDLVKRYQGQISIFAMPAPFDATCNRAYTSTDLVNQHGCELAKIALRVWIADPDQFEVFDDWLISPLKTVSPLQAMQRAQQLVGKDKFDATADNPLPTQILKHNIALKNSKLAPQLPNVIIGQKVVTGTPQNTLILEQHIFNQWHLKPTSYPTSKDFSP